MALSIQSQVLRMAQAARLMGSHHHQFSKVGERTASGLRINRASDDAAGLSIAESLRAQVRGNAAAAKNILDAGSLLNTADAAISRIADGLHRMRTLAVQSANGTYDAQQRQIMENEFRQLRQEINFVTREADFNGFWLLRGGEPSGWMTEPVRTVTDTYPGATRTRTITPQLETWPAGTVGASVTLGGAADVYGLGTAGPESIVVTAVDPGPPAATRTIPFDAANGYQYDAATRTISFNGTGLLAPTEQLRINYVPAGSTTMSLGAAAAPGSEVVTANGVPVANAGSPAGNGYYLNGGTVSLVGSARPDATDPPLTLSVEFQTQLPDSITLDMETPSFEGGILDPASLAVTVNGVLLGAGDYTIVQTPVEEVGSSTLYAYTIELNPAAVPTGAGPHTLRADYVFDRPTGVDPLEFEVQSGANNGMTHMLIIDRLTVGGLGLGDQHVRTQNEAQEVLGRLNESIRTMTGLRSRIGAYVNSLDHAHANVLNQREAMASAESTIRDADMAREMTEATRNRILRDGAMGMVSNIQQNATYLLQLLG